MQTHAGRWRLSLLPATHCHRPWHCLNPSAFYCAPCLAATEAESGLGGERASGWGAGVGWVRGVWHVCGFAVFGLSGERVRQAHMETNSCSSCHFLHLTSQI